MFFFNDTAPTEFYPYGHTLSRHDALPISRRQDRAAPGGARAPRRCRGPSARRTVRAPATGRAGSARGRGPPGHSRGRSWPAYRPPHSPWRGSPFPFSSAPPEPPDAALRKAGLFGRAALSVAKHGRRRDVARPVKVTDHHPTVQMPQSANSQRPQPKSTDAAVIQAVERALAELRRGASVRSEEHTSELQSLLRISYAVFCLKKNKQTSHLTIAH